MPVTDATRQQLGRAALAIVGWSYMGYAYTLRTWPALHPPLCPFLALTGIPCPLCGTTRAWDATLHGDLTTALRFHPLAPIALPLWIFSDNGADPQWGRAASTLPEDAAHKVLEAGVRKNARSPEPAIIRIQMAVPRSHCVAFLGIPDTVARTMSSSLTSRKSS
jgi:hypothetical protein